jgi:hypothetical protein
MRKIFPVLIMLIFFSCKKSTISNNTNPPQNVLQTQLSGNWKVVKYIISNFDTTQGRPYIPNDTILPIHPESKNFINDTLHYDTWETYGYDGTTNPYSFVNTQTREFTGSVYCTYATNYFVLHSSYNDTVLVKSISSNQLVTSENIPILFNPPSGVLYIINSYYQK